MPFKLGSYVYFVDYQCVLGIGYASFSLSKCILIKRSLNTLGCVYYRRIINR